MKTNWLSIAREWRTGGKALLQRVLLALLITVFVLASFPAPSVFARSGDTENAALIESLELAWSYKLRNVQAQSLFYDRVRLYPADFKNLSDLARAWDFLHKYGFALRQAETLIADRPGFDVRGRVTNLELAQDTIRNLSEHLRAMRGFREKLDAVPRRK